MTIKLNSLCVKCNHCCSEPKSKYFPAATYCLMDIFTNEGQDNYPDKVSCDLFEIDPELTPVNVAYQQMAMAAKEYDRLVIKGSVMELLTTGREAGEK